MRFLIITPPGSGQMIPHLNLSRKLEENGHEVLWAMPKPVLSKIEKAGFKYVEAGPENLNFEYRDLYCPDHSKTSGWDEFVLTADKLIMHPTPRIVKDILQKLSKSDFDAVISEVGSPAGPILGEIWGIPWICISTESLAYHNDEVPPYAFEDEQEEGRLLSDFHDGHKFICNRYNEVRKEFNLPPVKSGWNDLFSKFLTICVTTPELEYPRSEFPEGLIFTGALTDPSQDHNLDPILQQFINNHSAEKILYTTLGTVFNKYPNLMEKVIRGVFLSKATAVISTGPGYEVSDELLCQKPDNVLIVPWANHRALFPHIWAALTHGGMSTTSDTIAFALPTLHIPVGCDLPSLSRKIVYHKAGLRIPHKYATPEGIAQKVNELMASDEMKKNVTKLQKSFREAGGAPRAVQLIESALCARSMK